MPDGFIGKASQTYLTNVQEALSAAHAVHNKDPFAGCSYSRVPPPAISGGVNQFAPYSPEDAAGGGSITGVGNYTNVVVGQEAYEESLQMIRKLDMQVAEDLHRIASQIEEMCETIYVVPSTVPKYLAVVDKVKGSLGEFQTLTEQAVMQTYSFVDEIMRIDGK